jgi:hypothetical protein
MAIALSAFLLFLTVLAHYEVFGLVRALRLRWSIAGRTDLLLSITTALIAHILSISLYAVAFYWMHKHPELGTLRGEVGTHLSDFFYFSVTCYTTLGIGDVFPTGPMRVVAAFEGLNGLVLITWSATFAFSSAADGWSRG